jgi:hypothetical protein
LLFLVGKEEKTMRWNTSGEKTQTTVVLAGVACIAVMMLTMGLASSAPSRATPTRILPFASHAVDVNSQFVQYAASSHSYVVKPNGHDDTSDIQAAFNACTRTGQTCTVQLVKGIYYTAQITVFGFKGSFVGAGQGLTTIQALPNLPDPSAAFNTVSIPFWAGLPGVANPWPVLFTFVNGAFGITGMTIAELNANPILTPGWVNPPESGGGTYTALYAVVLITGEEAFAAIDHVTVIGAAGDMNPFYPLTGPNPSTFNVELGIAYAGMLLPTGWNDPWADQIPVSGTFSLTGSVLYYSEDAVWVENLLDASVMVCFNSIDSSPEPGFIDLSNSQLLFCGNRVTNVALYTGFGGGQSLYKTDLLPSTVYVTDNYFGTNWEGSGPSLFDYGPVFYGIPSTLNAVVTGNEIVSDNSCECFIQAVTDVIIDFSLESMVVSQNTIIGGGGGVEVNTASATVTGNTILGVDIGVILISAVGAHVVGNVIKNSVEYGIAVTSGSSNNVVAWNFVKNSGLDDLYWDETGTGNVWAHNACATSDPPGLC